MVHAGIDLCNSEHFLDLEMIYLPQMIPFHCYLHCHCHLHFQSYFPCMLLLLAVLLFECKLFSFIHFLPFPICFLFYMIFVFYRSSTFLILTFTWSSFFFFTISHPLFFCTFLITLHSPFLLSLAGQTVVFPYHFWAISHIFNRSTPVTHHI